MFGKLDRTSVERNIKKILPHNKMRDYEYKRLGTLSILAALDLHDGHVIAQVHDKHRSIKFISLLEASWVFIILPDPPSVSSWIIIPLKQFNDTLRNS